MEEKKDIFGIIMIVILFILITTAGVISYKNIDWNVLKRIESQQMILPTPIPASNSANISTVFY
jgi:hypothetical protein